MDNTTPKAPFSASKPLLPLSEALPKNPFSTTTPLPTDVPEDAPEGAYTYALIQSAPAVPAEECEVAAAAVEVVLRWGKTVLHVAHLSPPRSFYVGEASGNDAVDYALPADQLGAARFPVVRKAWDGSAYVVIPANAKGTVTSGGHAVAIADLAKDSRAEPSRDITGALEVPLRASTRARFEIGGVELEVASVQAGRKVTGRFSADRRGLPYQALSLAFHLGLLGAAAVFMPPMALAAEDGISSDQMYQIQMALMRSEEQPPEPVVDNVKGDAAAGDKSGSPAPGDRSNARAPAGGPKGARKASSGDNDPHIRRTREEAINAELDASIVSVLKSDAARPASRPVWGDSRMSFQSPDVSQAMWSDTFSEVNGSGGLALKGVGDQGGGPGQGVPLGTIDTYHPGGRPGGGLFPGGLRPRKQADLRMRPGDTVTSGQIPREVIQRIVRQNFGRFRLCYENGLRQNPNLAGRVSVRFVIGRDGAVSNVGNGGSDMPDSGVVSCVVRSFYGLSFPQPDGSGVVTVTYPISFAPAVK